MAIIPHDVMLDLGQVRLVYLNQVRMLDASVFWSCDTGTGNTVDKLVCIKVVFLCAQVYVGVMLELCICLFGLIEKSNVTRCRHCSLGNADCPQTGSSSGPYGFAAFKNHGMDIQRQNTRRTHHPFKRFDRLTNISEPSSS